MFNKRQGLNCISGGLDRVLDLVDKQRAAKAAGMYITTRIESSDIMYRLFNYP